MSCGCSPVKPGEKKKIDQYEVEDAVRTLIRAEEVKGNAELMKLVGAEVNKKKKAINSIADLKVAREEKVAEE